jgi:hypothetical protein
MVSGATWLAVVLAVVIDVTAAAAQFPPARSAPAGPAVVAPAAPAPVTPVTLLPDPRLSVSVRTDKVIFKNGERVKISGRVLNLAGDPRPAIVEITIARKDAAGKPDWNEPVYQNVLDVTAAEFSDDGHTIQLREASNFLYGQWVEFALGVRATPRGSSGVQAESVSSFAVQEIGYLWLAVIICVPGLFMFVSVSGTLWGCMRPANKPAAKVVLWVLYCSAIVYLGIPLVGPLLISVSPGTEAFFRSTPVGIVKVATEKMKDLQWALNLGGVVTGETVRGGFVVPLFVLILGMIGGVINMFLKLPDFLFTYHGIVDGSPEERSTVSALRSDVFRYFGYIIVGPFLAMVMYSIMALADFTSPLVLAVVAFSVGFRSNRVVDWILDFSSSYVDRAREKQRQADEQRPADDAQAAAARRDVPAAPPAPNGGAAPAGDQEGAPTAVPANGGAARPPA